MTMSLNNLIFQHLKKEIYHFNMKKILFILTMMIGLAGYSQASLSIKQGMTYEIDHLNPETHTNSYFSLAADVDFVKGKKMLAVGGEAYLLGNKPILGNLKVKFGWDVFNFGVGVNTGLISPDEVETLVALQEAEITLGAELNLLKNDKFGIVIGYDYFTGAKPYRYTSGVTAGIKLKFN